jgi:transcriptional regulator with XRE-family HTH domain
MQGALMATNPKTGSEEFGELLRRSRERLGMSRRDLVEATGLSYPYISQLETGYRQPSPAAIQKLADALQLSLDDLFSAMARGRRDEMSVSKESVSEEWDGSARWMPNASFTGAGAAPARMRRAARGRRPEGAYGRSAAPAPSDPTMGDPRQPEIWPEPASDVQVEQHYLEIPTMPEFDASADFDQVVVRVVELLNALPAQIRLEALARLQAEIVQSVIDEGIRDRLES